MDNSIQIFNYQDFRVRTYTDENGEVWLVAKDVCEVLGLSNPTEALRSLDDDEKMTLRDSEGHSGQRGGAQFYNVINEPGLYKLTFKSRKPDAKKFTRWVTHDVLPSIRKHGMYLSDKTADFLKKDPQAFDKLLQQFLTERDKNNALQQQLDNDRPFTILGKVVLAQPGCITFKDAADLLAQHGIDIGQNRLFKKCREQHLLCSRKGNQWNKPTKTALNKGLFNIEINNGFNTITVVTPQGMSYLVNLFAEEQFPLALIFERAANE